MKAILALGLLLLVVGCANIEPLGNESTNVTNDTMEMEDNTPEPQPESAPETPEPEVEVAPEVPPLPEPEVQTQTFRGFLLSGQKMDGQSTCIDDTIDAPTNPYEYSTKEDCEEAHKTVQGSETFTGYTFSVVDDTCIEETETTTFDPFDFHSKEDCDLYFSINILDPDVECRKGSTCFKDYALGRLDVSLCHKITDYANKATKDSCFEELAKLTGNLTICEEISFEVTQSECKAYAEIAQGNIDSSVCEQITSLTRLPYCYEYLAVLQKDYSYCDNIEFDTPKQDCQNKVSAALTVT